MTDTLLWWFVVQLLGLAAFPLGFVLFRRLPDGGYAFSKVVGLLVVGYAYWLALSFELLPNERWSIVLLAILMALGSLLVAWRSAAALRELVSARWKAFLTIDVLFFAAIAVAAFLRSYVPEIDGTEKPMDFAFLNAVVRAESFPPEDPWLAGHGISYYYFGHLLIGMMTVVSGVVPAVGYNLGLALVAALTVVVVFGLLWNLLTIAGRPSLAYFGAGGAVILLLVVANWEGFFELLAVHDAMPAWLYDFLDIDGLDGAKDSSSWYPTEFWFWWRASRIVSGWTIREFPFFSFLLGDLHAHVLALPFLISTVGLALSVFQGSAVDWRTWLSRPGTFVLAALLTGSLIFLNAWDFPTAVVLLGLAAVGVNLKSGMKVLQACSGALTFLLPLLAVGLLLYAPFLESFGSAAKFVAPVMVTNSPSYVGEQDMASNPIHLLLAWGPVLWLTGIFIAACLLRASQQSLQRWPWALVPLAIVMASWTGAVFYDAGVAGFLEEVADRGIAWLSFALLAAMLAGGGAAILSRLQQPVEDEMPPLFALALSWTGLLLVLGSELFYVEEFAAARLNTVFKLSFQAWVFLAAANAFAVCYLWNSRHELGLSARWPRFERASGPLVRGLAGVSVVFVAAALVYPVIATANRTEGLTKNQTLDGLEYVEQGKPDEYAAVEWLRENVDGSPVIVEAPGPDWGENARISWRTGLPTVIGWPSHEFIWRGTWEPQEGREQDVNSIYISDDRQRVEELIEKYDIRFIVVGPPEQALYGIDVLTKFDAVGRPVAVFGAVTIYAVNGFSDEVAALP
jgi:YYY domain-containing protein